MELMNICERDKNKLFKNFQTPLLRNQSELIIQLAELAFYS